MAQELNLPDSSSTITSLFSNKPLIITLGIVLLALLFLYWFKQVNQKLSNIK